MSMQQQQLQSNVIVEKQVRSVGDFENFPEITMKSRELLIARGITALFPV
jgi:hypothetical protein